MGRNQIYVRPLRARDAEREPSLGKGSGKSPKTGLGCPLFFGDDLHPRPGLFEADSRPQPAGHKAQTAVFHLAVFVGLEWQPDRRRLIELFEVEAAAQDAHNLI